LNELGVNIVPVGVDALRKAGFGTEEFELGEFADLGSTCSTRHDDERSSGLNTCELFKSQAVSPALVDVVGEHVFASFAERSFPVNDVGAFSFDVDQGVTRSSETEGVVDAELDGVDCGAVVFDPGAETSGVACCAPARAWGALNGFL
jgi:hypothetical protein